MDIIQHALENGVSLNVVKRQLRLDENLMYALRDKASNVNINIDEILKVAEEFYEELCSSENKQEDNKRGNSADLDIHP